MPVHEACAQGVRARSTSPRRFLYVLTLENGLVNLVLGQGGPNY